MSTPTIITVSGPPGSGTTTLSTALADELDYEYIYAGDIFREMAAERDMTLAEFTQLCEEDDSIDRQLDARMYDYAEEYAETDRGLILESRLAGWVAGTHADLRLWLDAPADTRLDRIDGRDSETVEEMQIREESEATRYKNYYGVDVSNLDIYDLVLNTARWDADAVQQLALTAINTYTPSADEGATEIPVSPAVFDYTHPEP